MMLPPREGFDRCEPTAVGSTAGFGGLIGGVSLRGRQAVAVGGAVGAVAGWSGSGDPFPCLRVVTRINFALKGLLTPSFSKSSESGLQADIRSERVVAAVPAGVAIAYLSFWGLR